VEKVGIAFGGVAFSASCDVLWLFALCACAFCAYKPKWAPIRTANNPAITIKLFGFIESLLCSCRMANLASNSGGLRIRTAQTRLWTGNTTATAPFRPASGNVHEHERPIFPKENRPCSVISLVGKDPVTHHFAVMAIVREPRKPFQVQ
jgi:hypothetical protein